MRLALQVLSAAFLLFPLAAFSGTSSELGIAIERNLGNGGGLGKETLVLECSAQSRKQCEITKISQSVKLKGKISYVDASRIVNDFFKIEEQRPSSGKSPSQPIIYWGAVRAGKTLKGAMGIAQDRYDLAVLMAEQEILRGFTQ